ncbi:MAG: hypothetical protein JNK74_18005 [Candidatus Hydrogenedentes bacterium]|nr:hypothetical protein [Candidatus Hydrogenedentota bacterium]
MLTVLVSGCQAKGCGNPYGTPDQATAIEDAMYQGSIADCVAAIAAARETRAVCVGCPDVEFARAAPDTTPPTLEDVATAWNTVHLPGLNTYGEDCPPIGREWPAAALGGYYARLAGYPAPEELLALIAKQVEGAQYGPAHAPEPLVTHVGLYGYAGRLAERSDPCYRGGVVRERVEEICGKLPQFCPAYTSGIWAGERFVVADFSVTPRAYDGGAAYDHGWAGALMVEAWLQAGTPEDRGLFEASARLAAAWSAKEPAVRNHNYTAKNIWLLAQLYALTGEAPFRDALVDRLERNLKPGVLMDRDADGLVDGMAHQPFAELNPVARTPGRMWDGHNSILWYQAMNTWAMTEAYCAFRDRGDVEEAGELRPFAVAMLDNMAWELTQLGPGVDIGEGAHPTPYALLVGLRKIAAAEGETHANWEAALAVLWNTGYFERFEGGRSTANCGLYLLHLSGAPFVPLGARVP